MEKATGSSAGSGRKPTPIKLDGVVKKRRNMRNSEGAMKEGSYTLETSALGSRVINTYSKDTTNVDKPEWLAIHDLGDPESDLLADLAAVVTTMKAENVVPVLWSKKGSSARIGFEEVLMIKRFPIPTRHTAHIPITVEPVTGLGQAIVFKFSSAEFFPIQPKASRKKTQSGGKSGAPGNGTGAAPNNGGPDTKAG